jgi:Na+-transporting methylmalonyl-CoA/oxaloacetate decarboxylase beta subunit
VLLIGFVAFSREDALSGILITGLVALLVFLFIAYKIANKKMSNNLLVPIGIIGILGYLITIPSSILTIFLYQQISRHALCKDLEEIHQ